MAWDVRPLVSWIVSEYEPAVRVGGGPGAYAAEPGGSQVDLYGSADLACILYQLGRLARTTEVRDAWAAVLTGFQDPLTGHFVERGTASHVDLHVSAFAIGALELLERDPAAPLRFADAYRRTAAVRAFLDELDWRSWVYLESHRGAALGSIFHNVAALRVPSWFEAYFVALYERLDPENGLFGVGKPPSGDLDGIGGTFHYAFVYDAWNRRLDHPAARIDAVLGLQGREGLWDEQNPWWLTLDAVYLLARAVEQCGHRRDEVDAAIGRALDRVVGQLADPDQRDEAFGSAMGTHALCAVVTLLAEAQRHLGIGEVATSQPLRPVLTRRPFI